MPDRPLVALILASLSVCACERAPDTTPAPAAPATEEAQPDPVSAALSGSAQRSLERRHPDAKIILSQQTFNTSGEQSVVCGHYTMVTGKGRRERLFVVSAVELRELTSTSDPRWTAACTEATPMPGSLDADDVANQAAALTRR